MASDLKFNRRHLRHDLILVAVLCVFILLTAIYLFILRPEGEVVCVTVDGKLYGKFSLSQDRVEDIVTGETKSQLNRLVISDGKVFVEQATCPDGICANHRPIFRDGESIICLPYRVVITVVEENKKSAPDALT